MRTQNTLDKNDHSPKIEMKFQNDIHLSTWNIVQSIKKPLNGHEILSEIYIRVPAKTYVNNNDSL